MTSETLGSFKRSRDEVNIPSPRPSKRNASPRYSSIFLSPPTTPKKGSTLSVLNKPKSTLLTSFRNVFSSKNLLESPTSDSEFPASPEFPSWINTTPPSSPRAYYESPLSPKEDIQSFDNSLVDEEVNNGLSNLKIELENQCHSIFTIPEILSKIISYVDEFTCLPCEETPIRRNPLSYEHALLIYKDERKATKAWNEALHSTIVNQGNPATKFEKQRNCLFNCLFVNKLWYQVTLEVVSTKHFFANESRWLQFVQSTSKRPLVRSESNTKLFIMHKLSKATQTEIDIISPSISGNLEWIEMYICPKVLPSSHMLSGSLLKKLIITGSKVVNNPFLELVAKTCPRLETLDLRACPLVSDDGVIAISNSCRSLKTLNLGRHTRNDSITDRSLFSIAHNTNIETLGLAGCSVTDRGIWELALHCSVSLSRLSLNNCSLLTDNSIPRIFAHGFFNQMSVLEIRNVLSFTNFRPLVEYKKKKEQLGSAVLIEGCEILEYRMREEEWKLDLRNSAMILNDISHWVNGDDSDIPYSEIMNRLYSKCPTTNA